MKSHAWSCKSSFSLIWMMFHSFRLIHLISIVHSSSILCVFLLLVETEVVYSVWTWKEHSWFWIVLNIFPTGVWPSAWYQLQIFFRVSFVCFCCFIHPTIIESVEVLRPSSILLPLSKSTHIIPWAFCFFFMKFVHFIVIFLFIKYI